MHCGQLFIVRCNFACFCLSKKANVNNSPKPLPRLHRGTPHQSWPACSPRIGFDVNWREHHISMIVFHDLPTFFTGQNKCKPNLLVPAHFNFPTFAGQNVLHSDCNSYYNGGQHSFSASASQTWQSVPECRIRTDCHASWKRRGEMLRHVRVTVIVVNESYLGRNGCGMLKHDDSDCHSWAVICSPMLRR
jgi:hypothetical protein